MKIIRRKFNLRFPSKEAKFENPNIGPLLSPHIPRPIINELCVDFNKKTSHLKSGLEIYITLTLFKDNTFFYIFKGVKPIFLLNLFTQKTYNYIFFIYYFNFFIVKKIKWNSNTTYSNLLVKLNFKNLLHSVLYNSSITKT